MTKIIYEYICGHMYTAEDIKKDNICIIKKLIVLCPVCDKNPKKYEDDLFNH